jgi:predicted RNA-binding Zn-ribbon protein involved in translation (DUF1610 family)
MTTDAIICPRCGARMNHHADKPIYSEDPNGNPEFLEEFYTCPNCGASASRRATKDI